MGDHTHSTYTLYQVAIIYRKVTHYIVHVLHVCVYILYIYMYMYNTMYVYTHVHGCMNPGALWTLHN